MTSKISNDSPGQGISRLSFLNTLWVVLGGHALVEVAGLILAFFQPKKTDSKEGDSAGILEAGAVDKFTLNSVTAFVRGKFYLARLEDGGFLALSRKCTYLGCTVPWSSKEMNFVCPCHVSVYDIRGEVVSAPAPRPLDLHRVFIANTRAVALTTLLITGVTTISTIPTQ